VLGAGRAVNASPVPQIQTAVDEALTSVGGVTDKQSKIDQFTLAADGAQDLALTYVPVVDSENLILRRLGLYLGVDYTLSDQTVSLINSDVAPLTGDLVQVQYDYLSGLPAMPASSVTEASSTTSGASPTPALPAGTSAGDFCVMFVGIDGSMSLTLNGWTDRDNATASGTPYPYTLHVLTKTVTSGSDVPGITYSSNMPVWASCRIISGSYVNVGTASSGTATSGTAPSVASADGAVRGWLTSGTGATMTAPGRISDFSLAGGTNIKILVGVEDDLTSVAATTDLNVAWAMASVGVNT